MKNIIIIIMLVLVGILGYTYFTSNLTEDGVKNTTETVIQEHINSWDNIDLPEEIRGYSDIEVCDTLEAAVCFGSGATFYGETKDVTIFSLISTVEVSRYGVQIKDTGELFIFSIEIEISDEEFDFGNVACYRYEGGEEGSVDTRELEIDIYGTKVTGTKSGYSQSGEYSVGHTGTIEGELDGLAGNTINAITTLTIADGGENRQEEIYVLGENSITEMRYRLVDDFENDILRIDKSATEAVEGQNFPIAYQYQKIDCSTFNNDIDVLPSRYICFTSDDQSSGKLMFGLDNNDKPLFAQYKGQEESIELGFVSKDIPSPGYPTYTLTYEEVIDGKVNGTYAQTHSGNYDYVEYTDSKGKVFNFTNIFEESYVNSSCL